MVDKVVAQALVEVYRVEYRKTRDMLAAREAEIDLMRQRSPLIYN